MRGDGDNDNERKEKGGVMGDEDEEEVEEETRRALGEGCDSGLVLANGVVRDKTQLADSGLAGRLGVGGETIGCGRAIDGCPLGFWGDAPAATGL